MYWQLRKTSAGSLSDAQYRLIANLNVLRLLCEKLMLPSSGINKRLWFIPPKPNTQLYLYVPLRFVMYSSASKPQTILVIVSTPKGRGHRGMNHVRIVR